MTALLSIPEGVSIVDYSMDGHVFYMDDFEVGAYEEIDENPPVCDYEVYAADSVMAQMCKERTMNDRRIAEEKRRVEEIMAMVEMKTEDYNSASLNVDKDGCEKERTIRSPEVKSKKHRKRSNDNDNKELRIVNNEIVSVKKSRKSETNSPIRYSIERRRNTDELMFVPILTID